MLHIRLVWKGLPETNSVNYGSETFYSAGPRATISDEKSSVASVPGIWLAAASVAAWTVEAAAVAATSATLAASLATFVAAVMAFDAKLFKAPNPKGILRCLG